MGKKEIALDILQVSRSCKALSSFTAKQPTHQPQPVWLVLTTRKFTDDSKLEPRLVPMVRRVFDRDAQICLFTKDPQKDWTDFLAKEEVETVDEVIGVGKIKTKYASGDAKRDLAATYQLFLADCRVVHLLPKLLGPKFYEKKRAIYPVELQPGTLKKSIKRACKSTLLLLTTGGCTSVRVGNTAMTPEQLAENVLQFQDFILPHIPGGWNSLLALHIKTADSIPLPIYTRSEKEDGEAQVPTQTNVLKRKSDQSPVDGRKSLKIDGTKPSTISVKKKIS